jgi:hypothetical protein
MSKDYDRLTFFHRTWAFCTVSAILMGMTFAAAFVMLQALPARASTFGIIEGTVTDAVTHAPVPNVRISAAAPSGRYTTTTNNQGFFSIAGVTPDTLTVSLELKGYEPVTVNGVSVFADQQARVDEQLQKSLRTIAQVQTRSPGGAFQPGSTADSYTVTRQQISDVLGNDLQTSQSKLLAALPGVSTTSGGLPVIRGGKGNSINYQVEGIPFSDAWSNQAVATRLSTGAVSELQLTPGVGSATYGNSGTGTVNVLARRGTYGEGAAAELGVGGPHYFHAVSLTYGFATSDDRWSNFTSFAGSNLAPLWGGPGAPSAGVIGQTNAQSLTADRHVTDNLVYRFGRNYHQSLQLYADLQSTAIGYGYGGGWETQCFNSCNQVGINNYGLQGVGLSEAQLCPLTHFYLGQTQCNQNLTRPLSIQEPHEAYKVGYTNALTSSTFVNASYYQDHALTTFDFIPDSYVPIGGWNRGVTLDLTHQLGSKNLLQVGGIYNAEQPFLGTVNPYQALYYTYYSPNTELYDFVPPGECPAAAVGAGGTANCGYLAQFFRNGLPKIPAEHLSANLSREDLDFYINDTWTPNSRIKADFGLREETANLHHPALYDLTTCTFSYVPLTWDTSNFDPTKPIGGANCPKATFPDLNPVFHPHFLEPRFAMSYRAGDNDAFRFTFGRSIRLPRDNSMENSYNFNEQSYADAGFGNIPSHWFDYGGTYQNPWYHLNPNGPYAHAGQCGAFAYDHANVKYEVPCVNYAEELAWDNNYAIGSSGTLSALVPETFTNYDFSYEHQFTSGGLRNVSFKVTPWYRRGFNAESSYFQTQTDAGGKPLFNPDGTPKTAPVELDASIGQDYADGVEVLFTKENRYGISGLFSATYTNSFSTAGDVYGGAVTPVSFLLGTPYSRINYISPFYTSLGLSYQTQSGWRISPYLHYNVGYPRGAGIYTPITFAGKGSYVPNTNVSGGANHSQFVDPVNPGSAFDPNIIATTGTDEGKYKNGALTHPFSSTDVTIEHQDRRGNVIGLTVLDLFNGTLWQGPQVNTSVSPAVAGIEPWQPIATGISGPYSGVNGFSYVYPRVDYNTPYKYGGNQPYYNFPQSEGRTWYLYFKFAKI